MADLILKNGRIVLPGRVVQADLVVENGKIAEISENGYAGKADRELDCRGKHVLSGGVDVHVHFRDPGMTHKENFRTGSEAALAGGITTILDMPNTKPPTVTISALEEKRKLAQEKCKCNFGFHFGISEEHFDELKLAEKEPDVYSFKAYMNDTTGGMIVSLELLERVFAEFSKLVTVHAEGEILKHVLHLAKKYDHRVHVAHLSSAEELSYFHKFKTDKVTAEVAPHHLFLDYEEHNYDVKPPLCSKEDQESLWGAVNEGLIDIVATDHAPHTLEEKKSDKPPFGLPGVETMLPLLLNEVNHGRLAIEDVVRLVSQRPAEIFGLEGRGRIEVGYDADLVVCDMELERVVENAKLKTKCGWSPFDGWKLRGWPVEVVLGGEVLQ